jgi:hypothetical protein
MKGPSGSAALETMAGIVQGWQRQWQQHQCQDGPNNSSSYQVVTPGIGSLFA